MIFIVILFTKFAKTVLQRNTVINTMKSFCKFKRVYSKTGLCIRVCFCTLHILVRFDLGIRYDIVRLDKNHGHDIGCLQWTSLDHMDLKHRNYVLRCTWEILLQMCVVHAQFQAAMHVTYQRIDHQCKLRHRYDIHVHDLLYFHGRL